MNLSNDHTSLKEQETENSVNKQLKDPGNQNSQASRDVKKENEVVCKLSNHDINDEIGDVFNGYENNSININNFNKVNDVSKKETNLMDFKSNNSEDSFFKNGFNLHKEHLQNDVCGVNEQCNVNNVSSSNEMKSENCEKLQEKFNSHPKFQKSDGISEKSIESHSEEASKDVEICSSVLPQTESENDAKSTDRENDSESGDVIIIGTSDSFEKGSEGDSLKSGTSSQSDEKLGLKCKSIGATKMGLDAGSSSSSSADASMTSFARMLHDLGVELVRQHVYKDLVDIQLSKDSQNKLSDREKEQLSKLEEFYSKQEARNSPYNLKSYVTRCKCRVFATDSLNVMQLHQEYGRMESGSIHVCCCCKEFKSRWPSHFITHMKTEHGMLGRLRKKMSPYKCSFCSYEAKNQLKIDTHMVTCSKRFVLACNLQPLPADTDIPLKRRFTQPVSYTSSQQRYSNYLTNASSSYTPNYHLTSQSSYYAQSSVLPSRANDSAISRGASLYSNLQSTVSGSSGTNLVHQQQLLKDGRTNVKHQTTVELCEICGVSMGNRAVLLNHLQIQHKVKLNTARGSTEPTMSCDRCPSRFWTYQGLAKHATVVHRINAGSSSVSGTSILHGAAGRTPPVCHICGESQTLNPLNHMSTRHNITLLDMYQVKQCYICNKSLKNGPAFQEHMVLYHRDIFANKDVLHTVLQALSAARHLKREESLQQQHQASSSTYSRYKKPMTGQSVNIVQSPAAINRTPTNKRRSQPVVQTVSSLKPQEKKSQEQDRAELEKLYENLAGIGRPILRSMRHKMSNSSLSSSPVTPISKASASVSTPVLTVSEPKCVPEVPNKVLEGTSKYSAESLEPPAKKIKTDVVPVGIPPQSQS